ncbi:MAG: nitronate monooxygenase [Candidatus Paceibacterota bacterium]|jgi:nitronate monooxygenase
MKGEPLPIVIQGGMGFAISTWKLARTVSLNGGLGTLSGVALDKVLALQLQEGDKEGDLRRAASHFPFPHVADMVFKEFFIEEGNPRGKKPRGIPVFTVSPPPLLIALSILGNFIYVWLAKEGHEFPISINYLEKIQMPHIYSIVGAMLAGVDYITVGAGIPRQIPKVINAILEGKKVEYKIAIEGIKKDDYVTMSFDPVAFLGGKLPCMKKPRFLPIVASNTLAELLSVRIPKDDLFGFVIEKPTAGGHNAPPRGKPIFSESGEPIYGTRDIVDYKEIQRLGFPFWIGGSTASPESLLSAMEAGAEGIQVGTAFALCEESGLDPALKRIVKAMAYRGELVVRTDPLASPTGYPFKVAQIPGTLSDKSVYENRKRSCALCVLRTLYRRKDGSIGYRCPSEPVESYVRKGGRKEDTVGRQCVCSGLMDAAGFGHSPAIITIGDDVNRLMPILMRHPYDTYAVRNVFEYHGL